MAGGWGVDLKLENPVRGTPGTMTSGSLRRITPPATAMSAATRPMNDP